MPNFILIIINIIENRFHLDLVNLIFVFKKVRQTSLNLFLWTIKKSNNKNSKEGMNLYKFKILSKIME